MEGGSNKLAKAASQAVAESPARNYNPLFLYGGVGLGKTHLLNSIGNRVLEKYPHYKIVFLHSEQFMNDLISSIQEGTIQEFKKYYHQSCDVLLMDDIQFLSGKDRTQEEFFHIFNELYDSEKQIVVTSDKFPEDIPHLEERLRSRFAWGLIADIHPPEWETRVAIIRKKAEFDNLKIPDDVANFLATNIESNVREIEGSLIRLSAYANIHNEEITLDLAKEAFKNIISIKSKVLGVDTIQKHVSKYFNIKIADIKSHRRTRNVALPRQIAMYLCRKHTSYSYPYIGEHFGGKDHSTVINAFQKIDRLINEDANLKSIIQDIEVHFV